MLRGVLMTQESNPTPTNFGFMVLGLGKPCVLLGLKNNVLWKGYATC